MMMIMLVALEFFSVSWQHVVIIDIKALLLEEINKQCKDDADCESSNKVKNLIQRHLFFMIIVHLQIQIAVAVVVVALS